jgi:hypothetical protein
MKNVREKTVKLLINQYNKEYYSSKLGKPLENGERIIIPVEWLPSTSGVKITTKCAYCGKWFVKSFRRFYETKDDICCSECRNKKIHKVEKDRYGTTCPLWTPQIHKKVLHTLREKYGSEHTHGREAVTRQQDTMKRRYGVTGTLANAELRKKAHKTMIERNHSCAVCVSTQQKHIARLMKAVLNYYFDPYFLDCYLPDSRLDIEYDGGGHNLCVKIGKKTAEVFAEEQKNRSLFLIKNNIRILHVVSKTDKMPSDSILSSVLGITIQKMLESNLMEYSIFLDDYLTGQE